MELNVEMEALIAEHGQVVIVFPVGEDEGVTTRAFMQVASDKSDQLKPTKLGVVCRETVNYFGSGALEMAPGMAVVWNGGRYDCVRAYPVYYGDTICYYRGVLERKGGMCDGRATIS